MREQYLASASFVIGITNFVDGHDSYNHYKEGNAIGRYFFAFNVVARRQHDVYLDNRESVGKEVDLPYVIPMDEYMKQFMENKTEHETYYTDEYLNV
jgi:hypothetical protein